MDLIRNIGIFTIGTISIAGAIVFIAKYILSKFFDGIFETYRLSLNKEIEKFKMDLQRQSYEHNVTFQKLHLERAEVIKNLYLKLVDMHDELTEYSKFVLKGDDKEIPVDLKISVGEFLVYANHNRIYFDDDISFNIKEIESIVIIILGSLQNSSENSTEFNTFIKSLVNEEIPKFKTILESQFRALLGVQKS